MCHIERDAVGSSHKSGCLPNVAPAVGSSVEGAVYVIQNHALPLVDAAMEGYSRERLKVRCLLTDGRMNG